jgi:hypothetical protein
VNQKSCHFSISFGSRTRRPAQWFVDELLRAEGQNVLLWAMINEKEGNPHVKARS